MTTINKKEIDKFDALSQEWWDVNGKFKPLHQFNPVRLELIINYIKNYFSINNNTNNLKGIKILDVGCGGGLISEPLARLGADITGIDASEKNIQAAKIHAKKNNIKINYIHGSPEQLNLKENFDVLLSLEIVEHVDNIELFLNSCRNLLKNNGIMFTATLNRTFSSFIKAIVGAEYVLRWLPVGTHDWNKFLKPEELEKMLEKLEFSLLELKGLNFSLLTNKWFISNKTDVNYMMISKKN
jgi:2-polyprenyl-6-hydroxyphenyl methylase/3-demethylubiquinone-9 3-methyltransferase